MKKNSANKNTGNFQLDTEPPFRFVNDERRVSRRLVESTYAGLHLQFNHEQLQERTTNQLAINSWHKTKYKIEVYLQLQEDKSIYEVKAVKLVKVKVPIKRFNMKSETRKHELAALTKVEGGPFEGKSKLEKIARTSRIKIHTSAEHIWNA